MQSPLRLPPPALQVQPDQRDGSDRKVTIQGLKESVAIARKLVEDIVSAVIIPPNKILPNKV